MFLLVFSFFLVWIIQNWVKMVIKCQKLPNPGLPFPVIGHSHHVLVSPIDIDERIQEIIDKADPHHRKVKETNPRPPSPQKVICKY